MYQIRYFKFKRTNKTTFFYTSQLIMSSEISSATKYSKARRSKEQIKQQITNCYNEKTIQPVLFFFCYFLFIFLGPQSGLSLSTYNKFAKQRRIQSSFPRNYFHLVIKLVRPITEGKAENQKTGTIRMSFSVSWTFMCQKDVIRFCGRLDVTTRSGRYPSQFIFAAI